MASRLRLNPRSDIHDCYLRLPTSLVSTHDRALALLKSSPETGPLCLVFSVAPSVYLGWAGQLSKQPDMVELNASFAQFLGLQSGQMLELRPWQALATESIEIEPVSVDDFQILQQNCDPVQEGLLNQISVVYANMTFPFFLPDNHMLRLRVSSEFPPHTPYYLSEECQLYIEQKIRRRETASLTPRPSQLLPPLNNNDLQEFSGTSSLLSRLTRLTHYLSSDDEVRTDLLYLNPCHSKMLHLQPGPCLVELHASTLWNNRAEQGFTPFFEKYDKDDQNQQQEQLKYDSQAIYLLRFDPSIPPEILKTRCTLRQQAFPLIQPCKLEPCQCEPMPQEIKLRVKVETQDSSLLLFFDNPFLHRLLLDLLCEIVDRSLKLPFLMTTSIDVPAIQLREYAEKVFESRDQETANALLSILETLLAKEPPRRGITALRGYISLQPPEGQLAHATGQKVLIAQEQEREKLIKALSSAQLTLEKGGDGTLLSSQEEEQHIALYESAYETMIQDLLKPYEEGFLFLESASPGVGKTFVCEKVLSRRLAEQGEALVSIDCRAIGFKMKDEEALQAGKSYIEMKFRAAEQSAPCVLLLDSIEDLLAQAEADPSQPFRLIRSQFFIAMVRSLVQKEAQVRMLATTRSAAKVGSALRDYGFFDRTISMRFPSQTQRKMLLQELMEPFYEAAQEEGRVEEAVALSQNFMLEDMLRLQSKVLLSQEISYSVLKQEIQNLPLASLASMDLVKTETTFSNIGGLERAKQAVRDALLLPSRFGRLFGQRRGSSGLLLYGPPGCGKTLLASAIGKECGLNLISVKGPELLSKYIGQSEQNVREAFEKAALAQPSVLFFDEFDSIVPRRGSGSTGVTDRLVNQFLTYLDGVEGRSGVYVVAASSRPDQIDVALLRPGRLDKQVYCGLPDLEERVQILKLYGQSMGLKEGGGPQFLSEIARRTETYTGADLKGVLYNAQLQTVHRALKDAKHTKEEIKEAPPLTEQDVLVALKAYHPSLGAEERARLEYIYRGFEGEKKIDVQKQLSTLF